MPGGVIRPRFHHVKYTARRQTRNEEKIANVNIRRRHSAPFHQRKAKGRQRC